VVLGGVFLTTTFSITEKSAANLEKPPHSRSVMLPSTLVCCVSQFVELSFFSFFLLEKILSEYYLN
jgi:hypothetical protein